MGHGGIYPKGADLRSERIQRPCQAEFFQRRLPGGSAGTLQCGLEAKATRAIDLHQGDRLQEAALQALIRAAVAFNLSGERKKA